MSTTEQKINAFYNAITTNTTVDKFMEFASASHLATLHSVVARDILTKYTYSGELEGVLKNLRNIFVQLSITNIMKLCKIRMNFFDDYCHVMSIKPTSDETKKIQDAINAFVNDYPSSIVTCLGSRTTHWLNYVNSSITKDERTKYLWTAFEADPTIINKFNAIRNYAGLAEQNAAVAFMFYKCTGKIKYRKFAINQLNIFEYNAAKRELISYIDTECDDVKLHVIHAIHTTAVKYVVSFKSAHSIKDMIKYKYSLEYIEKFPNSIFNDHELYNILSSANLSNKIALPDAIQYDNCMYKLGNGNKPLWFITKCPNKRSIRISTYLCLSDTVEIGLSEYNIILQIENENALYKCTYLCYKKFIKILESKIEESDLLEYLYYKLKEVNI